MTKKRQLIPLQPFIPKGGGVVVTKIPAGTPPAERAKALNWARNVAKKISRLEP